MSEGAAGPSERAPQVAGGSESDSFSRGTASWGLSSPQEGDSLKEKKKTKNKTTSNIVASEIREGVLHAELLLDSRRSPAGQEHKTME